MLDLWVHWFPCRHLLVFGSLLGNLQNELSQKYLQLLLAQFGGILSSSHQLLEVPLSDTFLHADAVQGFFGFVKLLI